MEERIQAKWNIENSIKTLAVTINKENFEHIFTFWDKIKEEQNWSVKYCNKCKIPKFAHENPWSETCTHSIFHQYFIFFNP